MAQIKLITVGELMGAIREAETMGMPPHKIKITVLDDRVDISHLEDPSKTVDGVAVGAVIQIMRYYGCDVQTQRTSQRLYP